MNKIFIFFFTYNLTLHLTQWISICAHLVVWRLSKSYYSSAKYFLTISLPLFIAPQLEEFPPWIIFSSTLKFLITWFLKRNIFGSVDWNDGPTIWPPRSPNATSLDLSFWDYKTDRMYITPAADVESLNAKIQTAVYTVTKDILKFKNKA